MIKALNMKLKLLSARVKKIINAVDILVFQVGHGMIFSMLTSQKFLEKI